MHDPVVLVIVVVFVLAMGVCFYGMSMGSW